jgi:hypothetical protein
MRKSDAKGVFVQVDQKDGKAKVTLDAVATSGKDAGKYLNEAAAELTVIAPGGNERKVAMTQTAPGRYVGEFPSADAGTYHVSMTQQLKGQQATQQSRGLVVNYNEELRIRPTNEAWLESMAKATGGVYRPEPESVFAPDERSASRPVPLWPYLLMIAAVLFLADVALRRIDFDLLLGRSKPPLKLMMTKP